MALLGKWFGFGREEIYDQAMLAYDHGDWECAIERFETCLDGANDASMVRLARFYIAESYAQLGNAFMRAGDYVDAVRNICAAIEISPNYPDLYIALARAFTKLGDTDRRRQAIEKALSINPKFVDGILEQGLYWYETGMREEGLAQMKRAIDIDASLDEQAYRQGMEAHEEQDFLRATAAFEGIAANDSDTGHIHLRLATSYLRERMYAEAAEEYALALELLPGYADLHCKYGQTLLELELVEDAILQFKEAIRLNPRYVQAHAYLGAALIRARQNDLASSELQMALELDPYNPVALKEVQRLRTA